MLRKTIRVAILAVCCTFVLAGAVWLYWWFTYPHYRVIQKDRDISFGPNDSSQFLISPAKIEVWNLKRGKTFSIPVNIVNKGSRMGFTIKDEQPPILDVGYKDATGFQDYSYEFSDSSVIVESYGTKSVLFSITKEVKTASSNQEKGFLIAQNPEMVYTITLARGYIFEVLIR